MAKYQIKRIDYDKCNNTIRDSLQIGRIINCHVSDNKTHPTKIEWVVAYIDDSIYPYMDTDGVKWKYALPVEKKTYVKSAIDVMKYLVSDGYKPDTMGDWIDGTKKEGRYGFVTSMWQYCGKEPHSSFYWPEGCLEEV